MEDLYENKILDDLYEIREGFITSYKKKYGELEETKKAEQAEDELVNFMKKFIKDENTMKELFEKINNKRRTRRNNERNIKERINSGRKRVYFVDA